MCGCTFLLSHCEWLSSYIWCHVRLNSWFFRFLVSGMAAARQQAMASFHDFLKSQPIEKFNGAQDLFVWLNRVEALIRAEEWSATIKYNLAVHVVTDEVWITVDALMPADVATRTWDHFTTALRDFYGARVGAVKYLEALEECRQSSAESVVAFASRFNMLLAQCGVTDRDSKRNTFKKALKPAIRDNMLGISFDSLAAVISRARAIEDDLPASSSSGSSASLGVVSSAPAVPPAPSAPMAVEAAGFARGLGRGRGQSPKLRKDQCSNCRGFGHWKDTCPSPDQGSSHRGFRGGFGGRGGQGFGGGLPSRGGRGASGKSVAFPDVDAHWYSKSYSHVIGTVNSVTQGAPRMEVLLTPTGGGAASFSAVADSAADFSLVSEDFITRVLRHRIHRPSAVNAVPDLCSLSNSLLSVLGVAFLRVGFAGRVWKSVRFIVVDRLPPSHQLIIGNDLLHSWKLIIDMETRRVSVKEQGSVVGAVVGGSND